MALDDDFAQRDVAQTQDVAPERLYSTPLSWDAPQPGVGTESYFNVNPAFNDPERQRLLAIAMGSGLTQLPAEPRNSAMDFTFDMQASPSATSDTTSNPPEPKHRRTSFAITSSAKTSRSNSRSGLITPSELNEPSVKKEKPRNSDRAAHNDIERKYRTNLKDRIADLREAIPSLRSIPEDFDDDGSPVPVSRAPKVSKVSISHLSELENMKLTSSRARSLPRQPSTFTNWRDATEACLTRTRSFSADYRPLSNCSALPQHLPHGNLRATALPSSTQQHDSLLRGSFNICQLLYSTMATTATN